MLTQEKVAAIQKDIQAALKEVADKHNLAMSGTKIVFSEIDFKLTTTFGDKAEIGDGVNPEFVRNLQRNGSLYGLDVSHVGKVITVGSRASLKFQGLRGKHAAMRAPDDKIYLYDAMLVAQLLRAAK